MIRYDKHGADRGWRGLWRLGRRLRARGYRQGRIFPTAPGGPPRSRVLAGARERVGFAESPAASYIHPRVMRPADGHEVERLLALAGGPPGAHRPVRLGPTADDCAAADAWLGRMAWA